METNTRRKVRKIKGETSSVKDFTEQKYSSVEMAIVENLLLFTFHLWVKECHQFILSDSRESGTVPQLGCSYTAASLWHPGTGQ